MSHPLIAAVFASGSGSNLQALLDRERAAGGGGEEGPPAASGAGRVEAPADGSGESPGEGSVESSGGDRRQGRAPWRTGLVVSDRAGAGALERARAAGVEARIVPVKGRDPSEVEAETLDALEEAEVDVVFLAGYLRLVPAGVVSAYRRRILNIHPALLPAFGGKGMWGRHVHEAVLASGVRLSGATVHFVDERYDEGTILAQWPVPVRPGDTPESLAARVLAVEHSLYPLAADHVCRTVGAGREPGPLILPGEAFSLVDTLDASRIAERLREAFPEPR